MADFKYTYTLDDFPNNKIDLDTLQDQVRASAITVSLDYISTIGINVNFFFKADLDTSNEAILDAVVAAHDGTPDSQEIPIVRSEQLIEHIRFVESGDTTQGLYAAQSLIIDVSTGQSEKTTDFSWPFDIALMSGTLGISNDMVGDDFSVDVGPNTLIGALIQPLNVGDTSVYVSPTVLENIKVGYYFGLYQGPDTGHELGQVHYIDAENNCLQIGIPSDVSANAMSPVSMCAKIIPNLFLHSMDKVEIGKQIPTGQRIPANLPVRVHYHSNNGVAKKISFFIEYIY